MSVCPSCEFVKRDERMAMGSGIWCGIWDPSWKGRITARLYCMCNTRSSRWPANRQHLKLTHKIYIIIAETATLAVTAASADCFMLCLPAVWL